MWLLENRKSRLWHPRVALTAGQPSAGAAATRWDEKQGGDGLPVLSGVGGTCTRVASEERSRGTLAEVAAPQAEGTAWKQAQSGRQWERPSVGCAERPGHRQGGHLCVLPGLVGFPWGRARPWGRREGTCWSWLCYRALSSPHGQGYWSMLGTGALWVGSGEDPLDCEDTRTGPRGQKARWRPRANTPSTESYCSCWRWR